MKQHIHNGRLLKCVAQEGKCPVSDMHFTTMESYNQFQEIKLLLVIQELTKSLEMKQKRSSIL